MFTYAKKTLLHGLNYTLPILKLAIISLIVGVAGGIIGGIFHRSVDIATELRNEYSFLIFALPFAGLLIVFIYKLMGLKKDPGTNSIISGVRGEGSIPCSLGISIFSGTILTHLFGGSAGREGAALQLGGAIGSFIGKSLHLNKKTLPLIILCGMSAVFSALFGTPLTAVIFAVEVCCVGSMFYSALLPCFISSYTAVFISHLFGNHPVRFCVLSVPKTDIFSVMAVIALGISCALVGIFFCMCMKRLHHISEDKLKNDYLRAFTGGCIIVALTLLCRTNDYNGAGMNVIERAMNGEAVPYAFLLKILFTAITIGCGFKGGEIVPTFFIGATFGCIIGPVVGLPASFGAAVGIAALFAAVVNCPVASVILALEIFGGNGILLYAAAIFTSYALSGYCGLYKQQKFVFSKQYFEIVNSKTK